MNGAVRDLQIDVYRALMMIYVPCVIHVVYCLGLVGEPWRSLVLFEMPVIFFISGATMYVTGNRRGVGETVRHRARRVLLPYYIYAAFMLCIAVAGLLFMPGIVPGGVSGRSLVRLALAFDDSLPLPYLWHTWFVLPFLAVACSFPLQRRLADRIDRRVYMALLFAVCCAGPVWTALGRLCLGSVFTVVREALFYNFFFMAGYLFYKRTTRRQLWLLLLCSGLAVAVYSAVEYAATGALPSMQAHKFPPDVFFLLFGVFAVALLALIFGGITIPSNRILRFWNSNGYTLYLWQNMSFWAYTVLLHRCGLHALLTPSALNAFIAAVAIFVLSTLTAIAVVPVERRLSAMLWPRRVSR